jgi:hypothetical protein
MAIVEAICDEFEFLGLRGVRARLGKLQFVAVDSPRVAIAIAYLRYGEGNPWVIEVRLRR